MMSGDILHNIFYQFDGETCARRIKEFFSGRKYNVQFNLHELQNAKITNVSNPGVFILLLTPHSYTFILSRKHLDLNAIFPNPELSVVLFFGVEKTKTEIRMLLSSRIRDFHKWTILEYLAGSSFDTIDKDIMNLVERSEGCSPAPFLQKFRVWTREGVKPHEELLLMFTKPVDNDSKVKVIQEWDGLERMARRMNPMTYSFTVGDVEPGERKIEVLVNDTSFGRNTLHVPCVESKIEEISKLLHNVINPIEFICQCLHVVPVSREDLDGKLQNLLSNNTSSVSQIFEDLNWERFGDSNSKYELPTLLHFGAKYGLKRFCVELLSLPGGKHALNMKNKDGMLPFQIAQKERFDDVALALKKGKKAVPNFLDTKYVAPSQPQRRIKRKDHVYLEVQSPIAEGNDTENTFNNSPPQACPMHSTNPSSRPMSSPSHEQTSSSPMSSPSHEKTSVQQRTNCTASHTNSVRSSSDSGLGEERISTTREHNSPFETESAKL